MPVWVVLNLFMNAYIVLRYGGEVAWAHLLKQVLPFMIFGVIIGLFLFPHVSGLALKEMLGILVVIFTGRQLFMAFSKSRSSKRPMSRLQAGVWQMLAGVCQVIYATGGPILVYSVSRMEFPKMVFRATTCTVWGMLNGLLVTIFILNGRINLESLKLCAWSLPVLPLGIFMGEFMHGRVNEKQFKRIKPICFFGGGARLGILKVKKRRLLKTVSFFH